MGLHCNRTRARGGVLYALSPIAAGAPPRGRAGENENESARAIRPNMIMRQTRRQKAGAVEFFPGAIIAAAAFAYLRVIRALSAAAKTRAGCAARGRPLLARYRSQPPAPYQADFIPFAFFARARYARLRDYA